MAPSTSRWEYFSSKLFFFLSSFRRRGQAFPNSRRNAVFPPTGNGAAAHGSESNDRKRKSSSRGFGSRESPRLLQSSFFCGVASSFFPHRANTSKDQKKSFRRKKKKGGRILRQVKKTTDLSLCSFLIPFQQVFLVTIDLKCFLMRLES